MIRPAGRDRGKLDPRDVIEAECGSCLFPRPVREYRFDASRRWRFDLAIPVHRIAIEIEGGVHVRGRHVRPTGYERDLEKYNRATVLGWRVLRYTPAQVMRGWVRRDVADIISRDAVRVANERMAAGRPVLPGRKRYRQVAECATVGPQVLVDGDTERRPAKLPENVWDV